MLGSNGVPNGVQVAPSSTLSNACACSPPPAFRSVDVRATTECGAFGRTATSTIHSPANWSPAHLQLHPVSFDTLRPPGRNPATSAWPAVRASAGSTTAICEIPSASSQRNAHVVPCSEDGKIPYAERTRTALGTLGEGTNRFGGGKRPLTQAR